MWTSAIEDFTAAHKFNALEAAEANVQTHVSVCEICSEIWQWTKFFSTNFGFPVNKISPMLHTH
jgi:epoxyqueuosine reductase QueG